VRLDSYRNLRYFKYVFEHARPILIGERVGDMVKKKVEGVRHSLASDIPCVKHRCLKCCLETRMPLSNLDLKRILKIGYRIEYFAVKTKEEWRLNLEDAFFF